MIDFDKLCIIRRKQEAERSECDCEEKMINRVDVSNRCNERYVKTFMN